MPDYGEDGYWKDLVWLADDGTLSPRCHLSHLTGTNIYLGQDGNVYRYSDGADGRWSGWEVWVTSQYTAKIVYVQN